MKKNACLVLVIGCWPYRGGMNGEGFFTLRIKKNLNMLGEWEMSLIMWQKPILFIKG